MTENILIRYIDSTSNKIYMKRGLGDTNNISWSGTYYLHIFNRSHEENYDNINDISGLKNNILLYHCCIFPSTAKSFGDLFKYNKIYFHEYKFVGRSTKL